MMKIYNKTILTGLALSLSFGLFTSCDDDTDYQPGETVGGPQVYFPSNVQTQYSLSGSASTFSVAVSRATASEAASVPITVTPMSGNTSNGAFTFPSSVSFNAGETTASYVVTYDVSMLEYDDSQLFELSIEDSSSTPYGSNAIDITVVYSSPWTLLGTGTYTDEYDWVNEDEGETTHVQFYQNDLDKTRFRVTNPYEWQITVERPDYFEFFLLPPGSSYAGVDIPEDFGVTIVAYDPFPVEYNANYSADMWLYFPARINGYQDPSTWVYNYVVDWQDNGLPGEIHLSPFYYMIGVGGFNQSNTEPIKMIFPGYEVLDTSVEVTYNGMLHKADESMEVIANVELGADVTEAKVAVVPGGSVGSSQLEGIQNGTIESVSVESSGEVKLPFNYATQSGKYSIVAVTYVNGDSRDYGYTTFSYTAGVPETWSLVGTGLYTYLEFWEENLGMEPEELELYESDATPGKFKIEHWFYDEDFLFTVNPDGTIYVEEEQPTGFSNGGAPVWVDDFTLWGTGAQGELEDGVYYFAVIYYNPQSGGYYAFGYESFEPSTVGTRSYSTRSGKATSNRVKPVKLISKKPTLSISKKNNLEAVTLR